MLYTCKAVVVSLFAHGDQDATTGAVGEEEVVDVKKAAVLNDPIVGVDGNI